MGIYFLVKDNKIINSIMWDGLSSLTLGDGIEAFEKPIESNAGIGWDFINGVAYDPQGCICFTIQTDKEGISENNQFKVPTYEGGIYNNIIIDWGDGIVETGLNTWNDLRWEHTYSEQGQYQISIKSEIFEGWSFNNGADKDKLISISDVGNLRLGNLGNSFEGCSNFTNISGGYLDLQNTNNLSKTFKNCTSLSTVNDLPYLNIFEVNDLSETFSGCINLSGDFECWEIVNLTSANNMLDGVTLSVENYNLLLERWGEQTPNSDVVFNAGNSQYSSNAAEQGKNNLINNYSWTIIDNGKV